MGAEQLTVLRKVARTTLGPDSRAAREIDLVIEAREQRLTVPAGIARFEAWMSDYMASDAAKREALLGDGKALLAARRADLAALIVSDPEAALLLAITPARRAALPTAWADQLERVVSGEGFYGVKAICVHPGAGEQDHPQGVGCTIEHEVFIDGRGYRASIYGTRLQRLTEESASLYGVALDGVIALHEDDVVLRSASDIEPQAASDQWAIIYRGKKSLANESELPARLQAFSRP